MQKRPDRAIYVVVMIAVVALIGLFLLYNSKTDADKYGYATSAIGGNEKNPSMYAKTPAFIVSDSDWIKALELVPVAVYTDNGVVKTNPMLIYHEEPLKQFYNNLASPFYGASVSVSSSVNLNSQAGRLTDDVLGSAWNSGSTDPGWVIIDLGAVKNFNKIDVWDYADRYYLSIQVADDDKNFRTIVSKKQLTASTGPNTLMLDLSSAYGTNAYGTTGARYVKFILEDSRAQATYPNWKQLNEIRIYDTTRKTQATPFDADSIINFLQTYAPGQIYIIGNAPSELGLLSKSIGVSYTQRTASAQDMLGFWSEYDEIVLSERNYEIALLASTYASLHNAPLVVVGDSIAASAYRRKTVYLAGNVRCPAGARRCISYPTTLSLQKQYLKETSSDKLLLVNPNDLRMIVDAELYPEKSTWPINQLYSKTSLGAPILASARKELIIFTHAPEIKHPFDVESTKNLNFLQQTADQTISEIHSQIHDFGADPQSFKYMTIMGAPNAIFDLVTDPTVYYLSFLTSQDIHYSTISPDNQLIQGRIYGLSISDVSSYIARDIYYDKLKMKLYGSQSTATIASRSVSEYDADAIRTYGAVEWMKSLGYDVVCSTEEYANCTDTNSYRLDDSFFINKQIIAFDDHGYDTKWANMKDSFDIPWLQVPVVMAPDACNTNHFWDISTVSSQFGATMLRRGAISYTGSVDANVFSFVPRYHVELGALLSPGTRTQGEAYAMALKLGEFSRDSFLGDPALSLSLTKSRGNAFNCTDYHQTTAYGTLQGYVMVDKILGDVYNFYYPYADYCSHYPAPDNKSVLYSSNIVTCTDAGIAYIETKCKEGYICDSRTMACVNDSSRKTAFGSVVSPLVKNVDIQLTATAPSTLHTGERVRFEFTIRSGVSGDAIITPYIYCPSIGMPQLMPESVKLTAGKPYRGNHTSIIVPKEMPSQTCTASISVNQYNKTFVKTVNFDVVTSPELYVKTITCKDEACTMPSKVFMQGERVYVKTVKSGPDGTPIKNGALSSMVENMQTTNMLLLNQLYSDPMQSVGVAPSSSGEYKITASASVSGYIGKSNKVVYTVVSQAWPREQK